jgi:hypothetical protein
VAIIGKRVLWHERADDTSLQSRPRKEDVVAARASKGVARMTLMLQGRIFGRTFRAAQRSVLRDYCIVARREGRSVSIAV